MLLHCNDYGGAISELEQAAAAFEKCAAVKRQSAIDLRDRAATGQTRRRASSCPEIAHGAFLCGFHRLIHFTNSFCGWVHSTFS